MGSVYTRPETGKLWIRYRDEHGRLRRVSSHTDDEEEAREQLRLIETQVHLKKRAQTAAGLTQKICDNASQMCLEARVAHLEHRLKAFEILVHQILIDSQEE